ncbi:DUF4383 domain-containing protein [Planosporangium flavigriseum]|uniref:DUF4383 domain-containing protein n=1 Tax=Planosporangium flavigriseum TaxID=373681 RepID=A0A8J3LS82_9ACTN|nr:DUF4383 domain-containing protein [Planosporangium flavigriseum]NJC63538.1 DUF4383 domain-containing protein [Planosporangium flavigriseum]GIG72235.1 hypothetical protein Pfl04_06390 [Planosporangium flavigriseum]
MAHIPINHPLRPLYRALSGLVGLYILIFGLIGFFRSSDFDFFGSHGAWVLGMRTNPAFAVLSVVAGAALLAGAVIGRNLFVLVNLAAGVVFLLAGITMLTLLRTEANFLAFSMVNVNVSFIFGMLFLAAGLYGKVGPTEGESAGATFRTGQPAHH